MIHRSHQVPPYSKEILDDTVDGEEPLGLAGRFEVGYLHVSLRSGVMWIPLKFLKAALLQVDILPSYKGKAS